MPVVEYAPGVPHEVRQALEPHLVKWSFLLPAWCHVLQVIWGEEHPQGALEMVAHYEYRSAELWVYSNYLTREDVREEKIIHELLHVSTAPMDLQMRQLRDALVRLCPDLEQWATENIRSSVESVVSDLARSLLTKPAWQ